MKIEFKTENDAFEENFSGEVEYVLTGILRQVGLGDDHGIVLDSNGNKIGKWSY